MRSESDGGPSDSARNLIARNRLATLGEQTKDFGAISLIAYEGAPAANTTIEHNCVRDVLGVYSDADGVVWDGYMSYGVYLDNEASGYAVRQNVLRGATRGNVFFHLGRDNAVENNVLVNATNADGHGGQLAVTGKAGVTGNNSFSRNVVAFSQTATSCVWYDGGGQANFKPHYLPAARVEANVYFPYSETVASRASPDMSVPTWFGAP